MCSYFIMTVIFFSFIMKVAPPAPHLVRARGSLSLFSSLFPTNIVFLIGILKAMFQDSCNRKQYLKIRASCILLFLKKMFPGLSTLETWQQYVLMPNDTLIGSMLHVVLFFQVSFKPILAPFVITLKSFACFATRRSECFTTVWSTTKTNDILTQFLPKCRRNIFHRYVIVLAVLFVCLCIGALVGLIACLFSCFLACLLVSQP